MPVMVALVLAALAPVAAQGQEEEPEATEVGVTADEIRIAVVADVENAAAPGLFQGAVDGVKGWAKFINKEGGLAGRDVKVDFIDSQLSADEARNAVIQACEEDVALVATSALFLSNVSDLVGCPDEAGNPTGLPDLALVVTEVDQQCNPTTFPINPPGIVCDTAGDSPETYKVPAGRSFYYQKEFGDLSGVFVYPSDLKSANNTTRVVGGGMIETGVEEVEQIDVSALAPQSAFTPVVQKIREEGATYAMNMSAFAGTVSLRKEAALQGVTDVEVWDCTIQCYDQGLIEQGGADVEDQFVSVNIVPVEERKQSDVADDFVKSVGKSKADGFSAQAWASASLFGTVIEAIVEEAGVNGITRAALLEQLAAVEDFDADGLIGPTDVGAREPSPCYALLQVQDGEFVRVYPKKKTTFDCKRRNVVEIELDLL